MAATKLQLAMFVALAVVHSIAAQRPRGGGRFSSCATQFEVDRQTAMEIINTMKVTDETSSNQKCFLKCAMEASRGGRGSSALDPTEISRNVQREAFMVSNFISQFGKNMTLDKDQLLADLTACGSSEADSECDTFYQKFSCMRDIISMENLQTYATFVEATAEEVQPHLARKVMMGGPRHGPPHRGHMRGGPGRPPRRNGPCGGDEDFQQGGGPGGRFGQDGREPPSAPGNDVEDFE